MNKSEEAVIFVTLSGVSVPFSLIHYLLSIILDAVRGMGEDLVTKRTIESFICTPLYGNAEKRPGLPFVEIPG